MAPPTFTKIVTVPQIASDIHAQLGKLFREKRRAAGVSQEDMIAHLGCSINKLRWHEAGARSLRADDLVRAAELLKCEPGELIQDGWGKDAEQAEAAHG